MNPARSRRMARSRRTCSVTCRFLAALALLRGLLLRWSRAVLARYGYSTRSIQRFLSLTQRRLRLGLVRRVQQREQIAANLLVIDAEHLRGSHGVAAVRR